MSFREFNYICPECSNPIRWYARSQQWGCDTCGWTGDELPVPDTNLASQETQIVESQETPSSASELDVPSDADDTDENFAAEADATDADEFPLDEAGSRIYYSENEGEYMYWYNHGVERWRDEADENMVTIIEYRDFNLTSTRWVGVRLGDKIRICIKDQDGIMYKYPEGKIVKVNNKYYFQITPEDIENSNLNFDHYREPGELINQNASGNLIGLARNDGTNVFVDCGLIAAGVATAFGAQRESMPVVSRSVVTPGSTEYDAMRASVRAAAAASSTGSTAIISVPRYRVSRRRASRAAPEGKVETTAIESKELEERQVALTELNKKLGLVLYFEISQTVSSSILRSKKANDIVMLEDTLISTLLQDEDNIVFQLDKEPFTAVVTTVQTLSNLLYHPDYLKHTKYQCLKENDALYYQESDIVISNDSMSNLPMQYKYNRHQYKFISGTFIGIFGGLLLRSQLEDIFRNIERSPNSSPKHFLYHIHDDIRVGPIISADKVSWSIEPSPESRSEQYFSQPWQRDYTEAHRPAGSMVSADHCQPGSKSLITIMPVRTPAPAPTPKKTTNKRKSSGASGKKTKRRKGGRKKRKTKRKKRMTKNRKKKKTKRRRKRRR